MLARGPGLPGQPADLPVVFAGAGREGMIMPRPSPLARKVPVAALALAAVVAVSAGLIGCGDGRLAGSGSVTTNGFTGRVLRDGQPAAGVRVTLYAEGWDPLREQALPDPR